MVKNEVIKEVESNFIVAGSRDKTIYLRIPKDMAYDSSYPFKDVKHVRIKMLKNKLIVEAAK